jgi:hypothetical protein
MQRNDHKPHRRAIFVGAGEPAVADNVGDEESPLFFGPRPFTPLIPVRPTPAPMTVKFIALQLQAHTMPGNIARERLRYIGTSTYMEG